MLNRGIMPCLSFIFVAVNSWHIKSKQMYLTLETYFEVLVTRFKEIQETKQLRKLFWFLWFFFLIFSACDHWLKKKKQTNKQTSNNLPGVDFTKIWEHHGPSIIQCISHVTVKKSYQQCVWPTPIKCLIWASPMFRPCTAHTRTFTGVSGSVDFTQQNSYSFSHYAALWLDSDSVVAVVNYQQWLYCHWQLSHSGAGS